LNPTSNPASNCIGEWDLCLSSTQFFRSSPFFQTLRTFLNDRDMAENVFEMHERATSASRVGRVRQIITAEEFISEIELEVGVLPGFPITAKGKVVTKASLQIAGPEFLELRITSTQIQGSNVPLLNQILENFQPEFRVGDVYNVLQGTVPLVRLKTFYVDEGIRITRDVDDNFFVFSRS
jgi:PAP_fibrillin